MFFFCFEILFDKFSIRPEESFFVDDVKKNTDAAEQLGMKAFCHEKGDVELLREALQSEGVKI